jgi:hypothetical protein
VPIYETRVNRELLLEFFLTFSRFEYALKAIGFFKKPDPEKYESTKPPSAEPDWSTFRVSLRNIFQMNRTETLKNACEYLLNMPPWKQVISKNADWKLAWETRLQRDKEKETDVEFLVRMVVCVRNNLFHGGKHGIAVHEDTERIEALLRNSLILLEECLVLVPQLRQAYEEAII